MNDLQSLRQGPFHSSSPHSQSDGQSVQEDWEDWSEHDTEHSERDDDRSDDGHGIYRAAEDNGNGEAPLLSPGGGLVSPARRRKDLYRQSGFRSEAATASSASVAAMRNSVQKPSRLKSRARQKAQNAKAGIRLVTDMTKLRKQQQQQQQQQLQQQQQQQQQQFTAGSSRVGKFVDADALRALEGKSSESSTGSWHWRKRKGSGSNKMIKEETPTAMSARDLSPNDGPIVIGISLPESAVAGHAVSPLTATAEMPLDIDRLALGAAAPPYQPSYLQPPQHPHQQGGYSGAQSPQSQLRSVWSPDTEDGSPSSAGTLRAASRTVSSMYSDASIYAPAGEVPPVPHVPAAYAGPGQVAASSRHDAAFDDYDDDSTPITLFEEDGVPVSAVSASASARRATFRRQNRLTSPASTVRSGRSGWWDLVRTPFAEHHPGSPLSAVTISPMTPVLSALSATTIDSLPAMHIVPAMPAMRAVPSLTDIPPTRNIPAAQAVSIMPAVSVAPSVAASIVTGQTPESIGRGVEWWQRPDGDDRQAGEAVATGTETPGKYSKPALGISTALANGRGFWLDVPSPTVASSSRSAPPSQQPAPRQGAPSVQSCNEKSALAAADRAEAAAAAAAAAMAGTEADARDGQGAQRAGEIRTAGDTTGDTTDDTSPADQPPPYAPPERPEMVVRYRAVLPPGHPLRPNFPPSPGPMSPGFTRAMASQGAIHLSEVPLTPPYARSEATAAGIMFPDRPTATFFPGPPMTAAAAKAERKRRRYEKEDAAAKRAGGLWRGRGCLPRNGCFGRNSGHVGRKRRRVCLGVIGGVLAAVALVAVLAAMLARKHKSTATTAYSFWLNTTEFPPMPTGVTSVVGAENSVNVPGCVQPQSLWSCSLPKEQQAAHAPLASSAPSFFIDIQFDNSSRQLWDTPDGTTPKAGGATATATSTQAFDGGFTPSPAPPTFQEMWFLGNTTDGIVADDKAGEPTPFYITFLSSLNTSVVGPNLVARQNQERSRVWKRSSSGSSSSSSGDSSSSSRGSATTTAARATAITVTETASTAPVITKTVSAKFAATTSTKTRAAATKTATSASSSSPAGSFSTAFPAPATNADGTGAPAVMHPLPVQQPLRLYDRGLPTEHFGFYTYFSKTIYVTSVDASLGIPTSDQDGGSYESEANFVVTWLQTRFLVQIWTRMGNTTKFIGAGGSATNDTIPGTFPYPITITEDLHGGDLNTKSVFAFPIDSQQHINTSDPLLHIDNLLFGGTLINHDNPDLGLGGTDGGTGGCKCAWANFIGLNGNTAI